MYNYRSGLQGRWVRNLVVTGKIEGRRGRENSRLKYVEGIKKRDHRQDCQR